MDALIRDVIDRTPPALDLASVKPAGVKPRQQRGESLAGLALQISWPDPVHPPTAIGQEQHRTAKQRVRRAGPADESPLIGSQVASNLHTIVLTDRSIAMVPSTPPAPPTHATQAPAGAAVVCRDDMTPVDWVPAAAPCTRRLASFFTLQEFDAADAGAHPETVERLHRRELQAAVVHGVLTQDEITALLAHVAAHEPSLPRSAFPAAFRSRFVGHNLNLAHPALHGYFEAASGFNTALDAMPPQPEGLGPRLRGLLSKLNRLAPVQAAPGPAPGQQYMFTTLRAHEPMGFIPAHFDNEMRLRPSYRHLATVVDAGFLSFVLALTQAESGGALEVFDQTREPTEAVLLSDDRHGGPIDTAGCASVRLRLPPGSMILLDSGRHLHRLTPIEGRHARWTVCSFMARSKTEPALLCWG